MMYSISLGEYPSPIQPVPGELAAFMESMPESLLNVVQMEDATSDLFDIDFRASNVDGGGDWNAVDVDAVDDDVTGGAAGRRSSIDFSSEKKLIPIFCKCSTGGQCYKQRTQEGLLILAKKEHF